ncbi:MAG: ATP-binding protein [Phaeospirillum sp.]|nr:ATP-binding protein [Phaeospirillum sp.]
MTWRRWWPLIVWFGLTVPVGGWFGANILAERDRVWRDAEERVQALSHLAIMHVDKLMEGADSALTAVSIMVGPSPDWNALSANHRLWRGLHDMGRSMVAVPRLVVIDSSGIIRVHGDVFPVPLTSLADRQYFQDHRGIASDRPLVGTPILGRVSQTPALTVSRRLSGEGGVFDGVVVANLHPQVFSEFFGSLANEEGCILSLQRGDGTLLVRYPVSDGAVGIKVDNSRFFPAITEGRSEGLAVTTSPVDGISRITAFKRLGRYDLVLIAGLPVGQVLAPWRQRVGQMAMVLGICFVGLTGLLVLLLQRRSAELAVQSRLRASEENLRQAQSVARLGYYVYDMVADGWISSDVLDEIFGIDSAYPRSARGWLDLVTPSMRPDLERYLGEILAGEHEFDLEYEIIRPGDGQRRWVAGVGKVERGGDGQPLRLVGTIQDITERKRVEQALAEKVAELARSNTELEQFAYVASHDLREPLRMVSSYVDLLGRRYADKLDDNAREYIAFAKDGAVRMDRLVLDLLEYSRIGRITQPMTLVPLDDILDRVLRALQGKAAEAGARVEVLTKPLPTVLGDAGELTRLLQNLIGNALKYRAADRPAVVTVTAETRGPVVELRIADNGIGIESQYFERVFLIFQRLHKRDEYEGTGIGLAICKKIVEHHGGRIWLESTPGEGSIFHIALPAVD